MTRSSCRPAGLRTRLFAVVALCFAGLTVCAGLAAADEPATESPGSLSAAEAQQLFENTFDDAIAAMAADPGALLEDADEIIDIRDHHTALVDPAGPDQRALVISTAPIETPSGELTDLDLDRDAGAIEPAAPVAPVELPESAGEPAIFGEDGIELSVEGAGAADPAARLVTAETGAEQVAAFYPNALTDTDLIWSPTLEGAELFAQVRSQESPEQLALDLDLPAGATLQAGANGGAVVLRDGEKLLEVQTPSAFDANGTPVPVSMQVSGGQILLHFDHRGEGFVHPILVDPVVSDSWNWAGGDTWGFNQWGYTTSSGAAYPSGLPKIEGKSSCKENIAQTTCTTSKRGLYIYVDPGEAINPGVYGQWVWTAPGADAYVSSFQASGWYEPAGGGNEPHGYLGIWGPSPGWLVGNPTNYRVSGSFNPTISAGAVQTGRNVIFGMQQSASTQVQTHASNFKWARIGVMTVQIDDPYAPTITGSSTNQPTTWVTAATAGPQPTYNITGTAADTGVGLKTVGLQAVPTSGPTVPVPMTSSLNSTCAGNKTYVCPASHNANGTYSLGGLPEGASTLQLVAADALGKPRVVTVGTSSVDRLQPAIELHDTLAAATGEEGFSQDADSDIEVLSLPRYRLDIGANDQNGALGVSGVSKVEVFQGRDEASLQRVYFEDGQCGAASCAATHDTAWTLDLADLEPGKHLIEVRVTDKAGNTRSRQVELDYNPATGIRDEYVMQYVELPDGSELAVNVATGNLVYRATDLTLQSDNADLSVERYYNSQLPATEASEWGDGWTIADAPAVDPDPSTIEVDGPTGYTDAQVTAPAAGDEIFDPELQAFVGETEAGQYELAYLGNDETFVLNGSGLVQRTEESNGAFVDYDYDSSGRLAQLAAEEPLVGAAEPVIDIEHLNGYVAEVDPPGPDLRSYTHDTAGRLTSAEQSEGQIVSYTYGSNGPSEGLLTTVTLPGGATATITYDSLDRVTSIVVTGAEDFDGATTFSYAVDETIVDDPTTPPATYMFAADGSMLRSAIGASNLQLFLSGSLYAADHQTLAPGEHTLNLSASGGLLSSLEIQNEGVIVGGFSCPDVPCDAMTETWSLEASELAPGVNDFEAFALRTNGESTSLRFQIYLPPPAESEEESEAPTPPPLADVLAFREQFGLATDPSLVEPMQTDPSFWGPLAEYGVPLKASEVAELEYRDSYIEEAGEVIPEFGATRPNAYVGYDVDNAAGGMIRVSFTQDALTNLNDLKQHFSAPDRLVLVESQPAESLATLEPIASAILEDARSGQLPAWVGFETTEIDIWAGKVIVGVHEATSAVIHELQTRYGMAIEVRASNSTADGKFYAGMYADIVEGTSCTLGFGAKDRVPRRSRGRGHWRYFALTASHCAVVGNDTHFRTWAYRGIGVVQRRTGEGPPGPDVAAILLKDPYAVPKTFAVFSHKRRVKAVQQQFDEGDKVCKTGQTTGVTCGEIEAIRLSLDGVTYLADYRSDDGDSGAPVWWNWRAVGIHSGRTDCGKFWLDRCSVFTPLSETAEPALGVRIFEHDMRVITPG